ncbi:cation diffusion facilitator family transporter [Zoogloea sp. LCSB751]|uniref:cation diffusion facilitator family transporter n=1 Tax=Zoogloea sp. LCSB751 TaxID=1965277 RepID=UPI0009A53817|nr:cation diffusion facilitator family transporter [Zoogloea sp. LCSB751]
MSFEAPSTAAPGETLDAERALKAQQATWVSVAVNVVLTVLQITVGLFSHAQSLVADGMHTLSDLLGDFLVMFASRHGASPADELHPYGHGRYETAASLVLGLILAGVGAGFLLTAAGRLQSLEVLPELHPMALWMALLTLAGKEGLFRYMLAVAQRLRSPMLVANAWHARADAASSLVVAVGIGGSLLGYRFLEPLGAALVGFMILRMGAMLGYEALRELIDTGVPPDEVAKIRATVTGTPGVLDVHELRTRRMAHRVLVDAHVRVDARISVSEGHRIAELARHRVRSRHEDVLDVLVHVDTEEDQIAAVGRTLPGREVLVSELETLLGDVPQAAPAVFHYVGERVEAEVYLPFEWCADADRLASLQQRLRDYCNGASSHWGRIALLCKIAP